MAHYNFDFTIIKEKTNKLDFDLYCVDINGLLDREKIYGYDDDTERFTAFQIAVLEWLSKWEHQPDIVHVHDHHAALIPFMMQHCFAYRHLARSVRCLPFTMPNTRDGWVGIRLLISRPGIPGNGDYWIGIIRSIHWHVV